MENARELAPIFGDVTARIDGGIARLSLPARSIAIFTVR